MKYTNMTHNSRKPWQTISKLADDPTTSSPPCLDSANQVPHQFLVNGTVNMPYTSKCPVLPLATEGDTSMVYTFSEEEYRQVVALLKTTKPLKEYGSQSLSVGAGNAQQMLNGKIRSQQYNGDSPRISPYGSLGKTAIPKRYRPYPSCVTRTHSTIE